MTTAIKTKTLDEVLYAFAVTKETPDAETLDRYVQLYPQYAEALTELAIELVLDSVHAEKPCAVEDANAASPAVMRAISHFENYSYELNKGIPTHSMNVITNPLLTLGRDGFRALAARLHANNAFIIKLRDRLVEPNSVIARTGFCREISEQLNVSEEAIFSHLKANPAIPAGQYYKSDNKPAIVKQESFEEAVQNSGLTEEQQRYILSL